MSTVIIRIAFMLAAVLLLATACTPLDSAGSPTPTAPNGGPTPTATAEALRAPEPLLDLECGDILPSSAVSAAYPAGVTAIDPAESIMGADPIISPTYALQSLGGMACEYSNGESFSSSRGTNPAYVGVRALVLPNAVAQWEKFIGYYGADGEGLRCSSAAGAMFCTFSSLVDGAWVSITAIGALSAETVDGLGAAAVAAISAADPGADPWTAPAGTAELPPDCAGIVPDSDVQALLGAPVATVSSLGGGGWSIESAALEDWGGPRCNWLYVDADLGVGSLNTLPGGAWAWALAAEFLTVPSAPAALDVAGLADADEAWLRCTSDGGECVLDLILGGNWVEAYLWPDAHDRSYDQRAGAEALATAIVASIG